jgi:hypothetical protein
MCNSRITFGFALLSAVFLTAAPPARAQQPTTL